MVLCVLDCQGVDTRSRIDESIIALRIAPIRLGKHLHICCENCVIFCSYSDKHVLNRRSYMPSNGIRKAWPTSVALDTERCAALVGHIHETAAVTHGQRGQSTAGDLALEGPTCHLLCAHADGRSRVECPMCTIWAP